MAHPDPSTVDGSDDDHDPFGHLAGLRPPPSGGVRDRFDDARHRVTAAPARSAAVLLGALAAAAVGWWFLRPPAAPLEGSVPLATAGGSSATATGASASSTLTSIPGSSTSTTDGSLVVQAAGGVLRGGVFRLPPGSRVDDLIRAAGGLATDADADRVNLAAPLTDGERVWVPRRGETSAPEVVAGAGGGGGGAASPRGTDGPTTGGGETAGPPAIVNLNTATAAELDTLPGVGPATASAILAYRSEHGRFASVDDLVEVRGIGDAKLEQLRASVTV